MSNFLWCLGRSVGLTDDDEGGDDNISRVSSYVEVNYLQGTNPQGRAPQNAERDHIITQGGVGNFFLPPSKTKGAFRGGGNTHRYAASRQTPKGEGGQGNNKRKGETFILPTFNRGASKGKKFEGCR